MTAIVDRAPSTEQLEQIRRISEVMYGESGLAFKHHGMPQTRQEASDLIRRLDKKRGSTVYGTDLPPRAQSVREEEKPVSDQKTCRKCGESKALNEFGKDSRTKDGFGHTCSQCKSEAISKGRGVKSKMSEKSEERTEAPRRLPDESPPKSTALPSDNGNWRARLTDPRLSELEQIQEAVGSATGLRVEMNLEEAAKLARALAEVL